VYGVGWIADASWLDSYNNGAPAVRLAVYSRNMSVEVTSHGL